MIVGSNVRLPAVEQCRWGVFDVECDSENMHSECENVVLGCSDARDVAGGSVVSVGSVR